VAELVKRGKITSDGAEWLTLAVDPFHDYQHQIAGYPDADGSSTVVQCFQYAYDISAGIAGGGGNWDLHVFNNPYCVNSLQLQQELANNGASENVGSLLTTQAGAFNIGGLINVVKANAGEGLYPFYSGAWTATNLVTNSNMVPAADILTPDSRVIGLGYELINTTAEINKQGALLAYRMPQIHELSQVAIQDATSSFIGEVTCRKMRMLPTTPAEAAKLAGSQQWDAAQGAYVVCTQSSVENPINNIVSVAPMHTRNGTYALNDYVPMGPVLLDLSAAKATGASAMRGMPTKYFPFNTSGVMLTGLSASSTFRLRVKVYVEVAPTAMGVVDAQLNVLATPSATFDFNALRMYSQIAQTMPVAVPVSMNAFGDWWKTICGVMSNIAVPALTAIGTAYGQPALGAAAGKVGSEIWKLQGSAFESGKTDKPKKPLNKPNNTMTDPNCRKVVSRRDKEPLHPVQDSIEEVKKGRRRRGKRKGGQAKA